MNAISKEKIEEIKILRLTEHYSIERISQELNISKGTASKYVNIIECMLPKMDKEKLRENIKTKGKGIKDAGSTIYRLRSRITELEISRPIEPIINNLSTIQKGMMAKYFVIYQLSRRGIPFFLPEEQSEALDILVLGSSGNYRRCEIKGDANRTGFSLRRTLRIGSLKTKDERYTLADKVDFFFLVDLVEEHIAIVPFNSIGGGSCGKLSPRSSYWKYLNSFHLL